MKGGLFKRVAGLFAAALALGSSGNSVMKVNSQGITHSVNKDAVANKGKPSNKDQRKIATGGEASRKHYRVYYRNQRQYRKWMRQCPWMRKSKKCKL